MEKERIRVLVAKPGTDGHHMGAELVVRALRDGGMEVIYLGCYQTTDKIVRAAMEEDVDVVALSLLSGSHLKWFPEIVQALKDSGSNALVVGGGVIPEQDKPTLEAVGVVGNYGPGTPSSVIVDFISNEANKRKAAVS